MSELQVMTRINAFKSKTRHFLSSRACRECGSLERYFKTWNDSDCICLGCFPDFDKIKSIGKTKSEINKHNEKVEKMKKDNWSIPIVYGGYNTTKG